MIIAVTGGTGYIGKNLITRLLKNDHHIRLLTRHNRSYEYFAKSEYSKYLTYYQGDLSDINSLESFTKSVDILFHCAAEIKDQKKMHRVNVEGTANLIEAAKGNVGRWIQLSSVGVYGRHQFGSISEKSNLNPVNDYEKSKAQSDLIVQDAASKGYFESTLLRPSIVFSWDMPSAFLFQLVSMVKKGYFFYIGQPGASANYIHVEDVVNALLLVSTHELSRNQVYNLSNYCTLEEFIDSIALALGVPSPKGRLSEPLVRFVTQVLQYVPYNPLKPSRINALTTRSLYPILKIERELGYQHNSLLSESIYKTVQVWKKN
ncbi:NAD(P)-dependent oxidoreductase [Spirulina major CS-329]|uniref:NAD-dependent epimerase/dehydratase family protein n=1 Tax=Spirulina TaxID=1154 RepID=UPI00232CBCDC|nr:MULTISPECIES: NAD(P)-dependent oxidoreductase [Spirulina]MDB9494344.1 NAD(P)-dependent oxidoreductase [Spirulina subsalsa CS-330]MDB9502334.1 NAD(P)-dependent oxidoreductase [Spirulina major CS-329]